MALTGCDIYSALTSNLMDNKQRRDAEQPQVDAVNAESAELEAKLKEMNEQQHALSQVTRQISADGHLYKVEG